MITQQQAKAGLAITLLSITLLAKCLALIGWPVIRIFLLGLPGLAILCWAIVLVWFFGTRRHAMWRPRPFGRQVADQEDDLQHREAALLQLQARLQQKRQAIHQLDTLHLTSWQFRGYLSLLDQLDHSLQATNLQLQYCHREQRELRSTLHRYQHEQQLQRARESVLELEQLRLQLEVEYELWTAAIAG